MGVDREHHLLDRRFKLKRGDALRDDLGGIRTYDVDAQNFAILRVCDDFDEAIMRIDDRRLRVADEGELADLDLESFFLGLGLRQADAGDLWIGIGATRNAGPIDRFGVFSSYSGRD